MIYFFIHRCWTLKIYKNDNVTMPVVEILSDAIRNGFQHEKFVALKELAHFQIDIIYSKFPSRPANLLPL